MDRNTLWEVLDLDRWLVALRKESVDRNVKIMNALSGLKRSLSARRAWIEILTRKTFAYVSYVALRKESVDRNIWSHTAPYLDNSRSPQGERG